MVLVVAAQVLRAAQPAVVIAVVAAIVKVVMQKYALSLFKNLLFIFNVWDVVNVWDIVVAAEMKVSPSFIQSQDSEDDRCVVVTSCAIAILNLK